MIKSHEVATLPIYVLQNYSKLGVTDKELLLLLHFQVIPDTGKSAWGIVATNMGYKTETTVTRLIESLVDKGLIELVGRGYDIDATKLYDACWQISEKPETVEIVITEKVKPEKKSGIDYAIARRIFELSKAVAYSNEHSFANKIKELREQGIPDEDFVDWYMWMDSGYAQWANKNKIGQNPVPVQKITYGNYQNWVSYGKPETYSIDEVKSKKKDFSNL